MYIFYGLDPETAERIEKAQFTPPDNWSGDYKGVKDILEAEHKWSVLNGERFDFNNAKHVKMLPDIINGVYVWCEKSKRIRVIKGGKGSGNFGHSGRPGKVGGSASGKGAAAGSVDKSVVSTYNELESLPSGEKSYFIMGNDKLLDVYQEQKRVYDHGTFLANYNKGRLFGLNDKDVEALEKADFDDPNFDKAWEKIFATGAIRVREAPNRLRQNIRQVNIQSKYADTKTFKRLQGLYGTALKFGHKDRIIWADNTGDVWIDTDLAEFLDADKVVGNYLKQITIIKKGGPGSGNFGHSGRPGKVGGSASGKVGGSVPSNNPVTAEEVPDKLEVPTYPSASLWLIGEDKDTGEMVLVTAKGDELYDHKWLAEDNDLQLSDAQPRGLVFEYEDKPIILMYDYNTKTPQLDLVRETLNNYDSILDQLGQVGRLPLLMVSYDAGFTAKKLRPEIFKELILIEQKGKIIKKETKMAKLKITLKGGPGSGNFGHSGRPGKVGGSASGKGKGGKGEGGGEYTVEQSWLDVMDDDEHIITVQVMGDEGPGPTIDEAEFFVFDVLMSNTDIEDAKFDKWNEIEVNPMLDELGEPYSDAWEITASAHVYPSKGKQLKSAVHLKGTIRVKD